MAQFSLHAYDADLWVQEFKGISQDESLNPDMRYAAEAENVETPGGVLQPHAAYELLRGTFNTRVETLARFHRRWYSGIGSKDWMVCATGGKLYYLQEGENTDWDQIAMPQGTTSFQSNVWSWVCYEQNVNDVTVDVLLMSNAKDGMLMIIPPDRAAIWDDHLEKTWNTEKSGTWGEVRSPNWTIRTIDTQGNKFGVIERYAERIWGGAIDGEPDKLVYSAPYDPTDWEANLEIPEDGAGEVLQPSWDGDSFKDLKAFGDQLIAFKEHRVWRVIGTSPGDYAFNEQFGGGSPFMNTVVVDGERIIMVDRDGLEIYDGMNVTPYARNQFDAIWRTVNRSAMDQMCAAMYDNRYYLAMPVNGSTVNNAMLVVNMTDGTILYYTDLQIESFMQLNERLYATSSDLPGRILILKYDSWVEGKAIGSATKWVSPWTDFGYKKIVKGGFELYFTPEVQKEEVTLSISIQTEKKTKTKSYTVKPLNVIAPGLSWRDCQPHQWGTILSQYTWGVLGGRTDVTTREFRHKKLHFSGAGRRFRIIIETPYGVTAPWRLIGGLHLVVETDPD